MKVGVRSAVVLAAVLGGCGEDGNRRIVDSGVVADAPAVPDAPATSDALATHHVTITVVGSGMVTAGTETCTSSCQYTLAHGATLDLAAAPASGWRFGGWTGDCTSATTTLQLLVDADKACTATFVQQYTIAAIAGANGSVTAQVGTATCASATCTVDPDVTVTLTATAAAGYHFLAWSGTGCAPAGTNPLALANVDATCTASFAADPTFTATGVVQPAGAGTITATAGAGTCAAATCTGLPDGTPVMFGATANTGYQFEKWSATCGGGTSPMTTVAIAGADLVCTAAYRVETTGTLAGAGTGTIAGTTNDPGGSCSAATSPVCVADPADAVSFTVAPALGSVVQSWSGPCVPDAVTPTKATLAPVGNVPSTCTANLGIEWSVSLDRNAATDGAIAVTATSSSTLNVLGNSTDTAGTPAMWLGTLAAASGTPTSSILLTGPLAASPARGLAQANASSILVATGSNNLPLVARLSGATIDFKETLAYVQTGFTVTSNVPVGIVPSSDSLFRVASTLALMSPTGAPLREARLSAISATGTAAGDVLVCDTTTGATCGSCTGTDVLALASAGAAGTALVLRQSNTTAFVVALVSLTGTVTWARTVSFAAGATPTAITQLPSGTIAVVGVMPEAVGSGALDAFVVAFKPDGSPGFTTGAYGFALGRASPAASAVQDELFAAIPGQAGGLVVTGAATDTTTASLDGWLVAVGADGSLGTQAVYGGTGAESFRAAIVTTGNGAAMVGQTASFGSTADLWALRTTSTPASFAFNAASGGHVRATTAVKGTAPTVTTNPCITATTSTFSPAGAELTATSFSPALVREAP